jgi:outer membrane receptor for ferrienterochelin and colicins
MQKVKFLLLTIILLFVLVSNAQKAVLTGKICDKLGKPICGAHVMLNNTSISTISNLNGIFTLSDTLGAVIPLSIRYTGFESLSEHIHLKKKQNTHTFYMIESIIDLSEIVITGTGTQYHIDKAPVQTEIISKKDIAEFSGRNIEEMISNISSSIDYTSSSMGTNIKINGLGKDYVLILVNGKRLAGGIGGYADLSRINSADIEQIEIVKGASSTLYGSDAIAGVINIITKKNKHKFSVTNSSRLGEYGEFKQLNTISFNKDKLSSKTSFNYKQKGGYQLNNLKFNNKWESNHDLPFYVQTHYQPVNQTKAYTLSQFFEYELNKKLSINTNFSWYEKRLSFPFKAQMHSYYYNNKALSVSGKYKLKNKNLISFNIDYNKYLYYTVYPYKYNETYITSDKILSHTYYPGDRFKNSDQTNINTQIKGIINLTPNNKLSLGTEIQGEYLEAQYRLTHDNVQAYTYSIFAQDELKLHNNLDLVVGVRAIYHDKSGFTLTPKVTLMHKESKFTNRLTYSNGYKTPSLKELYYYYESERMGMHRLYLGNENLKPQQSHYISLSSEFKVSKFRTGLSIYVNRINNKIDYAIQATSYEHSRKGIEETKMRYNINKAQNIGFDWHFRYHILNSLILNGGYSYVNARNLTQNIRLNGVSEHSATTRLAYNKRWNQYKLNLTISGVYKSNRFYLEEDMQCSYAKAYQLWKVITSHTFYNIKHCNISVTTGIDNIFDYVDRSPYGSHYGTLNPGRTLFLALNFKFSN